LTIRTKPKVGRVVRTLGLREGAQIGISTVTKVTPCTDSANFFFDQGVSICLAWLPASFISKRLGDRSRSKETVNFQREPNSH